MSNFPISNIGKVIDVGRVIDVGALSASNQSSFSSGSVRKTVEMINSSPPKSAVASNVGVGNNSEALNALMGLLTSFFTQLFSLFADKNDKPVPDVAPSPPNIVPPVVPEPITPMPAVPTPPAPAPEPAAQISGLSSKRRGAKPDDIWSGFRQGPDGNCVTVSAIKAAMHRFGQSPTDIFQEVVKTNDGFHVVMRDGFRLTMTDRELAEGARGAQFVGADKGMLKDAQFLFAVSAKRAQMENNDGTASRSYQAAIRSLNNGEDERGPGEGFLRLGLKQHMKKVSVRDLARGQIGMCNRTGHSVAVINGREELWGRQGSAPTRGDAIALV